MNTQYRPPRVLTCLSCNVALIPVERKKGSCIVGTFAGLLMFIGFILLMSGGVLGGLLVIIIGLLFAALGSSKKTVMFCPACGKDRKI